MIDREKVIELAQKAGARMVYVWGNPNPTVEGMDIINYTKLLLEEALNGLSNQPEHQPGAEERTDGEVATGRPEPDPNGAGDGDVQLGRRGGKKKVEKTEEGLSSGT